MSFRTELRSRSILFLLGASALCGCPRGSEHAPGVALGAGTPPGGAVRDDGAPAKPLGDEAVRADAGPEGPVAFAAFRAAASEQVQSVVGSSNAFATNLYARLQATPGNFALSPISIATALGMTYAGARGETRAEMRKVLHLELDDEATARAFGTLLRGFNEGASRPYELAVANRLFGEKTQRFHAEFLGLTANHYQAKLEPLDFIGAADASRQHINGWVEDRTKQRIKNLLPAGSITGDTRLVLTNAVYFKGQWSVAFPKDATKAAPFFAASGAHDVPTMHLSSRFRYGDSDGVELLEMPYMGDDFALTVLLPRAKDGLGELERKLDSAALARWQSAAKLHKVEVALPRFEIDPPEPVALARTLAALGMPQLFDGARANLTGMAQPEPGTNLVVSDVFHKAFVELNEKGTEAAAATGVVVVRNTSVEIELPAAVFHANHPFVFLIRDIKSGALLFMGRVANPA